MENLIASLPTMISNNLSIAVVGICVIFFVALLVSRMWTPKNHEEISNGISWSKDGQINRRQQRVK